MNSFIISIITQSCFAGSGLLFSNFYYFDIILIPMITQLFFFQYINQNTNPEHIFYENGVPIEIYSEIVNQLNANIDNTQFFSSLFKSHHASQYNLALFLLYSGFCLYTFNYSDNLLELPRLNPPIKKLC